jgi:acyl dehydratase
VITHSQGAAVSFFDDVQIGQRFRSGTYAVSEQSIRAFAEQYDPQPFHLDAEAARASMFGALIASGWQTAAITMRLTLEGGPRFAHGTVGLGAEVSWQRPVRAGDSLYATMEVIDKIPSQSRADRGRVIMRIETCNQRDEVVQLLTAKVLVPRRASTST